MLTCAFIPYTHRKTKNHDDCTTTVYCIKIIKMRDTTTNTIDCCILLTLHCTSLLYTTINIFDDVCVCTTILHIHNTTHTHSYGCVYVISLSNILRFVYDFISQFISGTDADKLYNQMYSD